LLHLWLHRRCAGRGTRGQAGRTPADLRREWPNLVMGGSVWSSAASRFVIVIGLLLHEGEAVAPGLVLERIGPKAVVLRWRDRRVEVPL
jgi:general secretion pathway protein B